MAAERSAAAGASPADTLAERFALKALVEACLVLEEGVAGATDIEVGMMAGAGIVPGPFARADAQGLDAVLDALDRARQAWGEWFEPPLVLRRLVAQGRLGRDAGQGFFPYPRPDAGQTREGVLLESRGDIAIAWLVRPPANLLSPQLIRELADLWAQIDGELRVLVLASTNPFVFSAGADLKEFSKPEVADDIDELIDIGHSFMWAMERSSTVTIASVNSLALGGGCELAMACDLRLAAESASFAQPEINLGIIPGFGGTQRLPRLIGHGKALELNLTGVSIDAFEALRLGLVNQVVPDHELFDMTLAWARRLADQPPIAVQQIKRRSLGGDLGAALQVEKEGFTTAFRSADAAEGLAAFLSKRRASFKGT